VSLASQYNSNINLNSQQDKEYKQQIEQLQSTLLRVCEAKSIEPPLTRQNFIDICKAFNLHCSAKLAIEAIFVCRGSKMEQSSTFDISALLEFLVQ
jgi:hypothetical protein